MKTIISFMVLMMMATGIYACTGTASDESKTSSAATLAQKVEVYYFHFTRRCATCQKVESESKKAVESLYPEQVKKGEITFRSINLDEKEGEVIGAKYKIESQCLVVISGEKRTDLTDKAFLYANNSPEKLKAEIKKTVDGMLK